MTIEINALPILGLSEYLLSVADVIGSQVPDIFTKTGSYWNTHQLFTIMDQKQNFATYRNGTYDKLENVQHSSNTVIEDIKSP